jgi:hypothetical protein
LKKAGRYVIIIPVTRRCDGIGRRSGLKIHRWQQHAGSSPATGTMSEQTVLAPLPAKAESCVSLRCSSFQTATHCAGLAVCFFGRGYFFSSLFPRRSKLCSLRFRLKPKAAYRCVAPPFKPRHMQRCIPMVWGCTFAYLYYLTIRCRRCLLLLKPQYPGVFLGLLDLAQH